MMSGAVAGAEKKSAPKETKSVFKCPLDSEEFDTSEQLSQHVDQVHIGPGLLSGFKGESWAKDLKKKD